MNDSVASARVAAEGAAAGCNAARDSAIREAASVVAAGDDVARRDAAALAAQDAALRCEAASSAAQAAAARCEAVAEEAAAENLASLHDAAAAAAQQAQAAAASCDSDGAAVAASAAANAFADSCVVACGDAAVLALAAREAAARCVLARDDAVNAALVAQWAARGNAAGRWGLTRASLTIALFGDRWCRDVAHDKVARESAKFHKKACIDAVVAEFAARKAAVRCAAASRRALSAASVARKTASRCEAAGGDGAAAAAAAREAASRCVADIATAVVAEAAAVPRADAAASEARAAAASCDAALAHPAEHPESAGGLMTVAALFVGIAYQAIIQSPSWMSREHSSLSSKSDKAAFGAPAPAPAATTDKDTSLDYWRTIMYFALNTGTLAAALTMLVVQLTMKKSSSTPALRYLKDKLVILLAVCVAGSFIMATPGFEGLLGAGFLVSHVVVQLPLLHIFILRVWMK